MMESPAAQPAPGLGDLRIYYAAARYWVAFMLYILGFSQSLRAPATGMLSELDAPLAEVSGLRLLLYFYDYSAGYAIIVGLLFVGAAALLVFPRSALIGALIALPMLANLTFLALFFRAGLALTMFAVLLLFSVLFTISLHWPELREAIWDRQNTLWTRAPARTSPATAFVLRTAIVLAAFAFTYWLRSTRGAQDTPLGGAWTVESIERFGERHQANTVIDSASTIYFEPDFAHLAVLKTPDGRRQARFDVDPATSAVTIRTPFRQPARDVFRGFFSRADDRLTLDGRIGTDSVRIVLRDLR